MPTLEELDRDLFDTSQPTTVASLRQSIIQESVRQGVDPALALSVAQRESRFDPRAVSPTGVAGLFQVTNETGRPYGQTPTTRTDPAVSMRTGIAHLRTLLHEERGNVRAALARYGDPDETDYPDKVLANYTAQLNSLPEEIRPRRQGKQAVAPRAMSLDDIEKDLFGGKPATSAQPQAAPAPAQPVPSAEPLPTVVPNSDPRQPATLQLPGQLPGQQPVPQQPQPMPPQGQQPGRRQQPPGTAIVSRIEPLLAQAQPVVEGNLLSDVGQAASEGTAAPGTLGRAAWETGREALATGIETATTMGGAAAGALTGPAAPVVSPVAAGLASYGGRRLNQALGLRAGEPTVLPETLEDVAALTVPMLPGLLPVAKGAIRATRAGRALTAAEQQTKEEAAEYLAKYTAEVQKGMSAAAKSEASYTTQASRFETQEARRLAAHAEKVARIEQQIETAYPEAAREARALQQQYREALREYKTASGVYQKSLQDVQDLPARYQPGMPARTMYDVQRDLVLLEQGGRDADDVVRRLGATDINQATTQLSAEGEALMQAGAEYVPKSAVRPPAPTLPGQLPLTQQAGPELQQFIRKQGGIRLADEELQGEFAAVLRPKETRTTGLLNNKGGKTAQEIAESAAEQGFIDTPDKESLLAALRESVTEGRPVHARTGGAEGTFGTAEASLQAARAVSQRGPHAASRALYQRLKDVAGADPVDISAGHETASLLQAELGTALDTAGLSRVKGILTRLQEREAVVPVSELHDMLTELTPLTQSANGRIRAQAMRLRGNLQDALEQAPGSGAELRREAGRVWRLENMAEEMRDIVKIGGPVVKYRQGEVSFNPDALQNLVETRILQEPMYTGVLGPEDIARMRADVGRFGGMTRPTAPSLPGNIPVTLPEMPAPFVPRLPSARLMQGSPELYVRPPYEPPAQVEPRVEFPGRGRLMGDIGVGATAGWLGGLGSTGTPLLAGGIMTADVLEALVSKILLSPIGRPLLQRAMRPNGTIDPATIGAIAASLGLMSEERGQPVPTLPGGR